jgi:hypothetical protein
MSCEIRREPSWQQYGKGELKHDPEWIQKHLQLHEVKSIELVRELRTPQSFARSFESSSLQSPIATS